MKRNSAMPTGEEHGERERKEEVEGCLASIEALYGMVPFVPQVLAERPDLFLPYYELSKAVLFEPKHLDRKTLELAAVAAGSALASEHCLTVHLQQAEAAGASRDEILEALLVGSYMTLTRSQSVSLRAFKKMGGCKEGE